MRSMPGMYSAVHQAAHDRVWHGVLACLHQHSLAASPSLREQPDSLFDYVCNGVEIFAGWSLPTAGGRCIMSVTHHCRGLVRIQPEPVPQTNYMSQPTW